MSVPKCFSFNKSGLRCMAVGGHVGPHAHAIEWTDEESWTPDRGNGGVTTALIEYAVPTRDDEVEHLVEVKMGSGKCVICTHPMHTGMCTGIDKTDGVPCNCANGVEE